MFTVTNNVDYRLNLVINTDNFVDALRAAELHLQSRGIKILESNAEEQSALGEYRPSKGNYRLDVVLLFRRIGVSKDGVLDLPGFDSPDCLCIDPAT